MHPSPPVARCPSRHPSHPPSRPRPEGRAVSEGRPTFQASSSPDAPRRRRLHAQAGPLSLPPPLLSTATRSETFRGTRCPQNGTHSLNVSDLSQYLVLQPSKLPLLGGGLCPGCPPPGCWALSSPPAVSRVLDTSCEKPPFGLPGTSPGLPCSPGKKPLALPLHPGPEHLTSTPPTQSGFSSSREDRALPLARLLFFLPHDSPVQPVSLTWEPTV